MKITEIRKATVPARPTFVQMADGIESCTKDKERFAFFNAPKLYNGENSISTDDYVVLKLSIVTALGLEGLALKTDAKHELEA